MALWSAGLKMRSSAERASKWGGIACYAEAARITLANITSIAVADKPLGNAIAWFTGASLFPILIVAAGLGLRRGEGWVLGGLASFLLALDFVLYTPELASVNAVTSVVTKIALFTLMVNGARGALALRKIDYSTASTAPTTN